MQEAQQASEEARRKLADIESRLMKLDAEIGAIRDEAEKEGFAEAERIKAAAEEDARKIVASAEQEIAAAAKAARRQLTAYAADLAVGLAQKQIHVDAATDQALVRGFAGQMDAAPRGPGADNARVDGMIRSLAIGKGQELEHGFRRQHLCPGLCGRSFQRASRCAACGGDCVGSPDCWPRVRRFAARVGQSRGSRGTEAQVAGCDRKARRNRLKVTCAIWLRC
jgi:F0F1-type ATP synthase membrane subunit b/b'